ncbi:hypothetical protein O988_02814 [Pseudogymnoascus sp. VKM F-3808]|nr:hypothetical protein O988_02814 [Pseudogymnoascus sp. VKM F-3808]
MTELLDLPVELLTAILGLLRLQAVASLAKTNKPLSSISNPFLYQQDASGEDPKALRWAAEHGQMVTLRTAVGVIGDVNFPDREERTALHYTAYCYNETVDEIVNYLVKSNASLTATCKGRTALELACINQNFRSAMALIKAGAELTDGLLAICVSSIKAKSAGGLVPDEATEGFARLQESLISRLIGMEVPIDWIRNGQTALMRAVSDGELSTVELLLQLGANVNSTGDNDTTPLMCAVYSRKGQCVELLVTAGADVNLKMKGGVSALFFLPPSEVSQHTARIWARLLRHGSNIEEDYWYAKYSHISIFELAIYEALKGNYLPLDLIAEHSQCVTELSIKRVLRLLDKAQYNAPRFLECGRIRIDDEWLISLREMETGCTLQDLRRSIVTYTTNERAGAMTIKAMAEAAHQLKFSEVIAQPKVEKGTVLQPESNSVSHFDSLCFGYRAHIGNALEPLGPS